MTTPAAKVYIKCHPKGYEIVMLTHHGFYYIHDCQTFEYAITEARSVAQKNNASYEGVIV